MKKKLLSAIVAACMAMSLCVSAFAAEADGVDGEASAEVSDGVEIDGAAEGVTTEDGEVANENTEADGEAAETSEPSSADFEGKDQPDTGVAGVGAVAGAAAIAAVAVVLSSKKFGKK